MKWIFYGYFMDIKWILYFLYGYEMDILYPYFHPKNRFGVCWGLTHPPSHTMVDPPYIVPIVKPTLPYFIHDILYIKFYKHIGGCFALHIALWVFSNRHYGQCLFNFCNLSTPVCILAYLLLLCQCRFLFFVSFFSSNKERGQIVKYICCELIVNRYCPSVKHIKVVLYIIYIWKF